MVRPFTIIYGLMIYVSRLPGPRIMWSVESSLPWLIATVAIVCVALLEETKLRREIGSEYEEYESRTPFLFPLPRFTLRIVSAPIRLVLGKDRPESGGGSGTGFWLVRRDSDRAVNSVCPIRLACREQAMWIHFPYDVPPFR